MDTKGRTALTLHALKIVDELRDRELVITYDYSIASMMRKPFVFFTGFLSMFAAAWVIGSLDMGIKGRK